MEVLSDLVWHPTLLDPTGRREGKPRKTGKTMVIDKGLGIRAFDDFLQSSAPHIDMIKIGFGTSVLYPREILHEKIKLAKAHELCILPGGTFLEVAVHNDVISAFFESIQFLGFTGIEVSDGTIDLSRQLRNQLIQKGIENNITVITEYGKKCMGSKLDIEDLIQTIEEDIEFGSSLVTIEGRESGIGVGIYDDHGKCKDEEIISVLEGVKDPDLLMWETPLKSQQVHFIQSLGPSINLGNIAPEDIMSLESLRRGLRSDTFSIHQH